MYITSILPAKPNMSDDGIYFADPKKVEELLRQRHGPSSGTSTSSANFDSNQLEGVEYYIPPSINNDESIQNQDSITSSTYSAVFDSNDLDGVEYYIPPSSEVQVGETPIPPGEGTDVPNVDAQQVRVTPMRTTVSTIYDEDHYALGKIHNRVHPLFHCLN